MGLSESTEQDPPPQKKSRQYVKEVRIAINAFIKGCQVAQVVANNLISAETITKKDNSPVTIADFSVQAVVISYLKKAFPEDPIVAEEKSKDLQAEELKQRVVSLTNSVLPEPLTEQEVLNAIDSGGCEGAQVVNRFWTLDPIDGTKGFLRAEQYAVCLALIENGEVVVGVLGCPNLPVKMSEPDGKKGCIFYAVKKQGAFSKSLSDEDKFQNIRVNDKSDPKETSILESVEAGHSSHGDAAEIAKILTITAPPVRMDSQCKYASLARGDASIYLRLPVSNTYQEKIWDHAAGCLIVTEAGGLVTDTNGLPLDFTVGRTLSRNKGVISTNLQAVHSKVLGAVEYVLYPPKSTYRITIKTRNPPSIDILRQEISKFLSLPAHLITINIIPSEDDQSSTTTNLSCQSSSPSSTSSLPSSIPSSSSSSIPSSSSSSSTTSSITN